MHRFFNKQRFGQPQLVAGLLLLVFLAQCAWLVRYDLSSGQMRSTERLVLERGSRQWQGKPEQNSLSGASGTEPLAQIPNPSPDTAAGDFHGWLQEWDPNHSALYYLVSSAALLLWPGPLENTSIARWGWLARAPGLLFGLCLGASVWYVARRLYGNASGYIALALFCFSPGVIRASAGWFSQPETGAAWGAFGAIFTSIAVAHTLYAPREVVLWNWRRILLLGVALALAIGSQFSLIVLIPMALAFQLYLAPERSKAALAIWAAACGIAALLLLASYFFQASAFWHGMRNARFFALTGPAFAMSGNYRQLVRQLIEICPALVVALPGALIVFLRWRRARYFGNTAPLLVSGLFLALALGMPHYPGLGFRLVAVPFLLLFISGSAADLLETRWRAVIAPALAGLLASYALWSLLELVRVRA